MPELVRSTLPGPPLRVGFPRANVGTVLDLMRELIGVIYLSHEYHARKDPQAHDAVFTEIANRFVFWIQQGVADPSGGVPAWPPMPERLPR